MTVRDQRAAALRRWHRDLSDNFTATLPRLLDDLEAIDQADAGPVAIIHVDGELTREVAGLLQQPAAPVKPAPVKPATRRRAAPK